MKEFSSQNHCSDNRLLNYYFIELLLVIQHTPEFSFFMQIQPIRQKKCVSQFFAIKNEHNHK